MKHDIAQYHHALSPEYKSICDLLYTEIVKGLPQADHKIWYGHPVWFLDGNPIVGYSSQKKGLRLMFWSGADFDETHLDILGKKFKDASIFFNDANDVHTADLQRWLQKSKAIQWDYKNIVKRKGALVRLEIDPQSSS